MVSGRMQAAWAERRALVEEFGVPFERVAVACYLNADALAERATKQNWKRPGMEALSRQERIARVHDRLLARIEREQLHADDSEGPLDKAGIAELAATARILAKISEITRDEDGAKEKQLERDADIAAILDRLDGQIVGLARYLAQEMARSELHAAGAAAGQP
mgnify:FL=1